MICIYNNCFKTLIYLILFRFIVSNKMIIFIEIYEENEKRSSTNSCLCRYTKHHQLFVQIELKIRI